MSQLLKKYALLTACAVLALCFATRPASAQTQMVNAKGMDGHLIFAYWSTEKNANTHLAIESPLGVRPSLANETKNVVRVMVKDRAGMKVADFRICLMGANTWTAVLSPSGDGSMLTVMAPGSCDDDVIQTTPQRERDVQPATLKDGMAMLDAMSGYIEAYVEPMETLMDVSAFDEPDAADNASDDGHARPIAGMAVLINPMSGFASSYNATAIGCRAAAANGDNDDETAIPMMCSADQIMMALHAENMNLLNGRWDATNMENIVSSTTSVVLTFPGKNHLEYKGTNATEGATADAAPVEATGADAGTVEFFDPVTLVMFDEMGGVVERNHKVMLDEMVNMCTFMPASMMPSDDDADETDAMMGTMLSCNGMMLAEGIDADAGSFRIVNNMVPITLASGDDTLVLGKGTETEGITFAAQTPAADRTPDDATDGDTQSRFAVVGLVMSYFMGGYGHYDTLTGLQSYYVDGDTEKTAGTTDSPITDDSEKLNGL